jgi:hypothetical protein
MVNRRQFLRCLLLGGAAGCTALGGDLTSTPAPTLRPPDWPGLTLQFRLEFVLKDDAVEYVADPEGCVGSTLAGRVVGPDGQGVEGLRVRVWAEGDSTALLARTDAEGFYFVRLSDELDQRAYRLLLTDGSGSVMLSEVIVAQSIPDCALNRMLANFVSP